MADWVRRRSFRARLGTLVAVAVGVTVALASLASYIAVHHQLYKQVDTSLESELNAFVDSDGNFNAGAASRLLPHYANSLVQVDDANGNPLPPDSQGPPLPFNSALANLATSDSGGYHFRDVVYQGQPYRVLTVGATSNGTPAVVQIARPLTDIHHTLSDLRIILLLVSLGGVVVAVGLGYLVGRATMRPVARLTAAAEHVAATQDLAATIDDQGDDELARLARAFNSMLAALAASRQQQSQLISDAGHELRTPLTSLRTNIEVLMRVRDLTDTDRSELMGDVQAQLEELTTLVGDVVELAREEEQQVEPIEVRFDAIVGHAVERARRRAPGVVFDFVATPGSVRAVPALLERAVLNVLDNAAKWSRRDGTVEVRLQRGASWALDVRDHGPGIASADLPHVFDRFYRAEGARSMPGSGLGLAIVHQVVTTHGGTVSASSPSTGGTLIHIELPTVVEHEPEPPFDAASPSEAEGPAFTPWGAPAAAPGPEDHLDLEGVGGPVNGPDPARPADEPATNPFAPPASPFAPKGDAHGSPGRDALDHIGHG